MENRETPLPMPATDMTVKLFRAMSNEQSKLGSSQTFIPGGICWDVCGSAARTRAIQRQHAYTADTFGRPGSMEEDLYNG